MVDRQERHHTLQISLWHDKAEEDLDALDERRRSPSPHSCLCRDIHFSVSVSRHICDRNMCVSVSRFADHSSAGKCLSQPTWHPGRRHLSGTRCELVEAGAPLSP